MSLSSLGVLAAHLSEENVEKLLAQAEGKTKEDVKEIVSAFRPKPAAEPAIRRKPVRSGESPQWRSDSAESAQPPERPVSRGESESRKPAGSIEVACADFVNIRFAAGKSMKEKLVRFAEVLGIDGATRHMPELFEKALDLALEKIDPKKKLERRRKRQAARSKTRLDEEAARSKTHPDEAKKREAPRCEGHERSRHIPSSVGQLQSRGRGLPSSLLFGRGPLFGHWGFSIVSPHRGQVIVDSATSRPLISRYRP